MARLPRAPRITKKDRIVALQIAAANHFENPKDTVIRAASYLPFIVRGPVLGKSAARKGIKTGGKRR